MVQFQIKRGYRENLLDDNNLPKIDLEEGCWYLTLDTAEIFVAIGGELKHLNEANIDLDKFDERFKSIEARLDTIEANAGKKELAFAEYDQFPTVGESDMLYIALDKNATYIYANSQYICVGNADSTVYDVISGGSAII